MPSTHYHWIDDTVLWESDANGSTNALFTYLGGGYGDLISESHPDVTLTHHYDSLGSTLAITDESASVLDRLVYSANGEIEMSTGATPSTFLWLGQHGCQTYDEGAAVYMRRRTYLPSLARFLSNEPIIAPWALRFQYSYALASPLTVVHASGMFYCGGEEKKRPTDAEIDAFVKLGLECEKNFGTPETLKKNPKFASLSTCITELCGTEPNINCDNCGDDSPYGCAYIDNEGNPALSICLNRPTSLVDMAETIQHELLHLLHMCALKNESKSFAPLMTDCNSCMIEELNSYICSGECKSPFACIESAKASCKTDASLEDTKFRTEPGEAGGCSKNSDPAIMFALVPDRGRCYYEDMTALTNAHRDWVRYINTYYGFNKGPTKGCEVLKPGVKKGECRTLAKQPTPDLKNTRPPKLKAP